MSISDLVMQAINPFVYQTTEEIETTLTFHGWNVGVNECVKVAVHQLHKAGKLTYTRRDNAPYRPWQYVRVVQS